MSPRPPQMRPSSELEGAAGQSVPSPLAVDSPSLISAAAVAPAGAQQDNKTTSSEELVVLMSEANHAQTPPPPRSRSRDRMRNCKLNPSWAGGHYCGPSVFNCHALLSNAWKQHVLCLVQ